MSENNNKSRPDLEYKSFSFKVLDCETKENGSQKIGVFSGAMATEDEDRGRDIIAPNAFDKTLARYKKEKRNIRLFYQHDTHSLPIGIIPEASVSKDGTKWDVKGELNLDTQGGKEVYSLLKQGALSDLSIGFSITDCEFKGDVRIIKEIELWEVSVVSEPMNAQATITDVKGATAFHDLPLAERDREWDASSALKRVREFTDSEDTPSPTYRAAFFWFDSENAKDFGAYKLPFADVVDGKLTAIPRGIFAAAGAMRGARGGVDIPEKDRERVITHINKYYKKMDLPSPLANKSIEQFIAYDGAVKTICNYDVEDLEGLIKSKKDLEKILRDSGTFSRKAATYLASLISLKQSESVNTEVVDVLEDIKSLINKL